MYRAGLALASPLSRGRAETVHYAIEIAFRGSVLSGYACHLVALWLSLVAFSLVIVLWSNTLNPPRLVLLALGCTSCFF